MTEPLKVVADVIRHELRLEPEQVLLYNQKFNIPNDDRLYVSVALLGVKHFGSSVRYSVDPVTGDMREVQSTNRLELVSVTLFSRSAEARVRNWEVPAALVGTYSEQAQEANSINIARLPAAMSDVSQLEGTARLNRYVLTIQVQAAYAKTMPTAAYDQFSAPALHTNA